MTKLEIHFPMKHFRFVKILMPFCLVLLVILWLSVRRFVEMLGG